MMIHTYLFFHPNVVLDCHTGVLGYNLISSPQASQSLSLKEVVAVVVLLHVVYWLYWNFVKKTPSQIHVSIDGA